MKQNKYGARKTVCQHGHKHDSAREARKCAELHLRQRAGEINGLQVQEFFPFILNGSVVKLKNGHKAGITVDFTFCENGRKVAVDSKGFVVRDFPLRWAMAQHLYPEIEWRLA